MKRIFLALLCAAALAPVLLGTVPPTRAEEVNVNVNGGEGEGSDNSIEANSAILGVNIGEDSDDNTIKTNRAAADNFNAIAVDDGDASLEIELDKSALSSSDMTGTVSFNRIENEDGRIENEVKLEGDAFRNTRGINQVAQNAGQNSLVQQNFTVQAPVVRDALFD